MRWIRGVKAAVLWLLPVGAWAQPYAFVTSAAGNSIAVIDLDDDVLVGSFPLDGLPAGSALTPNGARLYVALTAANSLASINTTTGAVTLTPVGAAPTGVATDGFYVYVANTSGDSISVYSIGTGTVLLTVPTGDSPLDLAVGDGNLYVANWGENTVSVFNTLSGMQLLGTIPVGTFPAGLALDPIAGRLYVANFLDDTISVMDTATLSVTASIPVGRRPRGLALDPAVGRLYVAGFENADIQVIDTSTNQVVLQGPSGGANAIDVALGPGGERLYVVHMQLGKSITALEAATLVPLTVIDAAPGPVTFAGFGAQAPPVVPRKPIKFRDIGTWFRRGPAAAIAGAGSRTRRPAATTDVVIADTTFDEIDWVEHDIGDFGVAQVTSGGSDGGAWRSTTYGEAADVSHEYIAASYDPSAQGSIGSIDVVWDHKLEGSGVASDGVLLFQNGLEYFATVPSIISQNWTSAGRAGLTAADFNDGLGATPDFGPAAAAMTFGYRSQASTFGMLHGIDSFTVTLHPSPIDGPGVLRFRHPAAMALYGDNIEVTVERVAGAQGAVSVHVESDTPCVRTPWQDLSWGNGDGSPRTLLLDLDTDCEGTHGVLARLDLVNPTGGATVDPRPMVLFFWPEQWGLLLTVVQIVLAGVSPLWLLVLAGPAAILVARRWRGTSASRS